MPLTTATANKSLDHLFGKTAFTMPTVYCGLSQATPNLAGGNVTEPTTGGYVRFTTSGATWNASANGVISNAADITFGPATGTDFLGGGLINYLTFHSASSGTGNLLGFVALTTPRTVLQGQTFKILGGTPGAFTETIS